MKKNTDYLKKSVISLSFFFFIILLSCKKEEEKSCIKITWYQDADFDGLGNKAVSQMACDQPIGYVANSTDTDDNPIKQAVIPTKGYTTPTTYAGLKVVWSDEFEGNSLNETYWNYELGDGCPTNCGWGNNELQYYKKENTSVKDGYLIIQAKSESSNGKNYTSSRLTTQNKINLKYGRIDIRAALPKGQGLWPALWMLGKNINSVGWPKCGEIDIMEMIGGGSGKDNKVYSTVHWDNAGSHAQYGQNTALASGVFNDEFHVFSMVWDDKKITSYLDDKPYYVIDITPAGLKAFQEEFFFIFNVAVGGNWPGNPDGTATFPQQMVVDYVRVFQ
jgi:beta-glucanase (GH16 family)